MKLFWNFLFWGDFLFLFFLLIGFFSIEDEPFLLGQSAIQSVVWALNCELELGVLFVFSLDLTPVVIRCPPHICTSSPNLQYPFG